MIALLQPCHSCMVRRLVALVAIVAAGAGTIHAPALAVTAAREPLGVSILVYHRFGPIVRDSMTVRTATLEWQLQYLEDHRYSVIPLSRVVAFLRGSPAPAPRSVVMTVDDGHQSVFTDLLPLVRARRIPVSLFIYPSAISNASYAMTWDELRVLRDTGLFAIESHTYWHPNFAEEKTRRASADYRAFATAQLCRSRAVLHEQLGVDADVLAWPFGIYDDELVGLARSCGYTAGLTLRARLLESSDAAMALPRLLVTDAAIGGRFKALLPP